MGDWLNPWPAVKRALVFSLDTLQSQVDVSGWKAFLKMTVGVVVFWHLYTPIHELLHVAACLLGGGTVTELALKPQYGGVLLQEVLPFVVPDSEYAGQLTGFSVPNYWVYAMVDLFPYLLSLPGLALMVAARRIGSPFLFSLALILAFVPLFSIPGDFYELVSLATTQVAESFMPWLDSGVLVSDDVFRSVAGLRSAGEWNLGLALLVLGGLAGAMYLAGLMLVVQCRIAARLPGAEELAAADPVVESGHLAVKSAQS